MLLKNKFAAPINNFQDSNELGSIYESELSVQSIMQSAIFNLLGAFRGLIACHCLFCSYFMCKSKEMHVDFSKFKVHTKEINVCKRKMVDNVSWQKHVRLIYKES